ncbi:hypothetical protein GN156_06825 [bacterium LRH843]|nr:hypothetical protein [bacterium LRH843]
MMNNKSVVRLCRKICWSLLPIMLVLFVLYDVNLSALLFIAMIVFVYIPILKQYERRLEIKAMSDIEKQGNEPMKSNTSIQSTMDMDRIRKDEDEFVADAISLNMGAGSFLVTLCFAFVTFLFVLSNGWGDSVTTFFLTLSLLLLAFSIWFPYSNFVKRQVIITPKTVKIGKRYIYPVEIRHVISRANGNMIEFHLTHTKEATQVRMEDKDKIATRDRLKKWCEKLQVKFIEK